MDATQGSISKWFKAGAAAIGMGRKLLTAQAVKDKDYDGIATKVSKCIERIKKARQK